MLYLLLGQLRCSSTMYNVEPTVKYKYISLLSSYYNPDKLQCPNVVLSQLTRSQQDAALPMLTCVVTLNAGALCSSSTLLKMSATTYSVTSKHSVVHPHCIHCVKYSLVESHLIPP